MYDRLSAQCEEHAGQELPVPGADKVAVTVHPQDTAVAVRPLSRGGVPLPWIWCALVRGAPGAGTARTFTTEQVVFAAGTWGTQQLLHRMKVVGSLPKVSARLGVLTRTNSEALGGALTTMRNKKRSHDFTLGVAITSSIHPDATSNPSATRARTPGWPSTVMTDSGAGAALREVARAGRAPSGTVRVPLLRH